MFKEQLFYWMYFHSIALLIRFQIIINCNPWKEKNVCFWPKTVCTRQVFMQMQSDDSGEWHQAIA